MHSSESCESFSAKTVKDYTSLIETVARVEYNRLSYASHIIEVSELINIGAVAVHVIISENPGVEFNSSYLSTAIRWAVRNELRRRYRWQFYKYKNKEEFEELNNSSDDEMDVSQGQLREAIYETILSINNLEDAENPTQIKDTALTPEESLELLELSKAIRQALKVLPPRERMIVESRFLKGKKIKELSDELKISSSRITRIIQNSLDKVKIELKKQGFS